MQPTFGVDEEFLLTDPETREPVAKNRAVADVIAAAAAATLS